MDVMRQDAAGLAIPRATGPGMPVVMGLPPGTGPEMPVTLGMEMAAGKPSATETWR